MMSKKITLLDGAMGTELRNKGCVVPSHLDSIWSAQVLMDNPAVVTQVHQEYIEAGADIIIANNYAVTQDLLERVGLRHQLKDLTQLSIDLAKQARQATKSNIKIAGSLPPLNTSYRADLVDTSPSIIKKYQEILEVLASEVDLIIIETMASSREALGALEACRGIDKEVWLSYTLHGNRQNILPSGEPLQAALEAVDSYNFQAQLLNCCATNQLTGGLQLIAQKNNRPFGGYANPEQVHTYSDLKGVDEQPEDLRKANTTSIGIPKYLEEVNKWLHLGATIIGGCCRTRPAHIRAIKNNILN